MFNQPPSQITGHLQKTLLFNPASHGGAEHRANHHDLSQSSLCLLRTARKQLDIRSAAYGSQSGHVSFLTGVNATNGRTIGESAVRRARVDQTPHRPLILPASSRRRCLHPWRLTLPIMRPGGHIPTPVINSRSAFRPTGL